MQKTSKRENKKIQKKKKKEREDPPLVLLCCQYLTSIWPALLVISIRQTHLKKKRKNI
jgi:hypothetical protein